VNCETVKNEMVSYLRGEGSPSDREAIASHLKGCLACRNEEAAVQGLLETFREATALEPSPGFRSRVLEAVRREGSRIRSSARIAQPRNLLVAFVRQRVRQAPILMAAIAVHAAAILILAGIYLPIRLTRTEPIRLDPGIPEPHVHEEKLNDAAVTSLPDEFASLRDPLKHNPESGSFPGLKEPPTIHGNPEPLPTDAPGPRLNPSDFNQPLRPGPTRAEVLAWFGCRIDGEGKLRAREAIGDEEGAKILAKGLRWLASVQGEDGSFDPAPFGGKPHFKVGISGLALLAFLGDGHSFLRGTYRRTVEKGIAYLMDVQDDASGRLGPAQGNYMYNHGIALLALCEAYGMTLIDRPSDRSSLKAFQGAIRKGIAYLLEGQAPRGGWGYTPQDAQGDASVTIWPMAALSTALRLKLLPPGRGGKAKKALDRAAASFRRVTHSDGRVGYRKLGNFKSGPHSLTAISLYCRGLFADTVTPRGEGIPEKQGRLVAHRKPTGQETPDLYFWYYAAFGLRHTGQEAFGSFYRQLVPVLSGLQEPDGSFPRRSVYGEYGGCLYTTAIALLTLEVPYRYPVK
jgi:hypothetical protein